MPRSSQPAVADFVQTYRRLLEYREGIVSVHIAGAMSGTVQSAQAAAREVDPARISVIDSCAVSVGAGLLLEAAGEAIAAGAGLDEVAVMLEQAKREIRIFGTVASLDFAVRGGRLSPGMARTADAPAPRRRSSSSTRRARPARVARRSASTAPSTPSSGAP